MPAKLMVIIKIVLRHALYANVVCKSFGTNTQSITVTAKYIIKDTFKIRGRGLVLAGYIEQGVIYVGDYIEFNALDKRRKRKITEVVGTTEANQDKTNTGLLIKCEDDNEIDELRTWRPNADIGIILKE